MARAVEAFHRAITLDPGQTSAGISLGKILEQQGHLKEALAWFRSVELARPNDVFNLMALVEIHWAKRRAPETLRLLKRAEPLAVKEFGPEHPRTQDIRQRIQFLENLRR